MLYTWTDIRTLNWGHVTVSADSVEEAKEKIKVYFIKEKKLFRTKKELNAFLEEINAEPDDTATDVVWFWGEDSW